MGSKGSKPRKKHGKPQQHQHLPKVGTATEAEREQHAERQAVLDNMGLGGASSGTRTILGIIAVVIVVAAILSLIGWVTFR
jgi:hypothetical protein